MFGLFDRTDKGVSPIGLDLGSVELKLVQLRACGGGGGDPREMPAGGATRIAAAAAVPVPPGAWRDPPVLTRFFRDAVRPVLNDGGFRGRDAVLALPAAHTHATRVRVPAFDDQLIASALQRGGREWLPFPHGQAMMRHLPAGEVYDREGVGQEVVTLASHRGALERCLDAAGNAKLKIRAVVPEPVALIAAMRYAGGKPPAPLSHLLVDLGQSGARAYIVREDRLMFARPIAAGVAAAEKLAAELQMCRTYFESTFATAPVGELIFCGGGTRDRAACRAIAEAVGVPARVLNPVARLSPPSSPPAVGATRYAVAVGLCLSSDRRASRQTLAVA